MENKVKIGIIGFLSILAAFGGGVYLTPSEFEHLYYCTATNEVGIFYGDTSQTQITAYPFAENRTQPTYCLTSENTKVPWVRLTEYTKEIGIDPLEFIQKASEIPGQPLNIGKKYLCSVEGCMEIK